LGIYPENFGTELGGHEIPAGLRHRDTHVATLQARIARVEPHRIQELPEVLPSGSIPILSAVTRSIKRRHNVPSAIRGPLFVQQAIDNVNLAAQVAGPRQCCIDTGHLILGQRPLLFVRLRLDGTGLFEGSLILTLKLPQIVIGVELGLVIHRYLLPSISSILSSTHKLCARIASARSRASSSARRDSARSDTERATTIVCRYAGIVTGPTSRTSATRVISRR